jgi:3-hydroxyacyl-[acyl-carrier-protein] dehydratase
MPENEQNKVFDVIDIMKHIPHRYPFLLVDRVTEITPEGGKGYKNVTINEEFFQGHFPGRPIMPGVLIIEGMAQCAGYIGLKIQEKNGNISGESLIFFMMIDKAKFRKPVLPGDRLDYEIEIIKLSSRILKFKGTARVDGAVAAEAELTAMLSS